MEPLFFVSSRPVRDQTQEVHPLPLRIVSWNIARRSEPWEVLGAMDADIALLQEATAPPVKLAQRIAVDPAPWCIPGTDASRPWRTAIARLSERVSVTWIPTRSLAEATEEDWPVSRPGTCTVAQVSAPDVAPFLVVSLYAPWSRPHPITGSRWIMADASALIGREAGHRILVAGDWNILHGQGEGGSPYWAARYGTVFTRMAALGLAFVGPQAPQGRQADPWPDELPTDSRNVPTYHSNQQTPATATRQLDFVFASRGLADSVRVRACNDPDQWGPSDHCRLVIEVA